MATTSSSMRRRLAKARFAPSAFSVKKALKAALPTASTPGVAPKT